MSSGKIAEIRARHDAVNNVLRGSAQMHDDRGYLLAEVERLTRERDEARAEVERLRGDAQAIAEIAHSGGTVGLSEHEALVEIRRRSLSAWDRKASSARIKP